MPGEYLWCGVGCEGQPGSVVHEYVCGCRHVRFRVQRPVPDVRSERVASNTMHCRDRWGCTYTPGRVRQIPALQRVVKHAQSAAGSEAWRARAWAARLRRLAARNIHMVTVKIAVRIRTKNVRKPCGYTIDLRIRAKNPPTKGTHMSEHTSPPGASRASRLAVAGIVASALFMGLGGAAASAAPNPQVAASASATIHQIAKPKPRNLGPCWAQAGRVVGGFWVAVGTTIAQPWAGVPAWAAYGGALAGEKKTKSGSFAC